MVMRQARIAAVFAALLFLVAACTSPQGLRPTPFEFDPATVTVEPNELVTSPEVVIRGITAPVDARVTAGATLFINDEEVGAAGKVGPDGRLHIQVRASSTPGESVVVGVNVGGVLANFTVVTRDAVNNPQPLEFDPITNAEPGATVTSDTAVVSGLEAEATVTVAGEGSPILVVNGEDAEGSTTAVVTNDDEVAIRVTASATFGATVTVTVDIDGVTSEFQVTTRDAVNEPGSLAFPSISGAEPGAIVTSDPAVVSGLETTATVSVTGDGSPVVIVNGDAGSAGPNATVANGDEVAIRVTASSDLGGTVTVEVDLDGAISQFQVTTRAATPVSITWEPTPATAEPGEVVELAWNVSGDFTELSLSDDRTGTLVDVLGSTTHSVTIPGDVPTVSYTLSASYDGGTPTTANSSAISIPMWVCQNPADVITFADSSLETRFRAIPTIPDSGDLTCADAQSIFVWNTGDWRDAPGDVESLVGVQHLVNLTDFTVQYNEIEDISPLAGLVNLQYLNLDKNRILDLSPLSGLVNLRVLEVWDNGPVRDNLTGDPTDLVCRDGISDISPLTSLVAIEELYISCNNISDISALAGMSSLRVLFALSNSIVDLGPLTGSTSIEGALLRDNRITGAGPVFGTLSELVWLDASNNRLQTADIQGLGTLTNLNSAVLDSNFINDFGALEDNAQFPTGVAAGIPLEPATPTVSIAFNCLTAVNAQASHDAFVDKGLTVGAAWATQRSVDACAAQGVDGGIPAALGAGQLDQQLLNEFRRNYDRR